MIEIRSTNLGFPLHAYPLYRGRLLGNELCTLGQQTSNVAHEIMYFFVSDPTYSVFFISAKSNYAWQLGDEVESRKHAKTARLFVILGVIAGLVTYVLALTLFFTISPLRPGA